MTDTTKQIPKPFAWAMRMPGCDGSADWVELGEQEPAPCPPAVAHPLYDQAAIDAAVEQAYARQNASWRLMCEKLIAAERERWAGEVAAWRERFPGYTYRPQDDCVALKA